MAQQSHSSVRRLDSRARVRYDVLFQKWEGHYKEVYHLQTLLTSTCSGVEGGVEKELGFDSERRPNLGSPWRLRLTLETITPRPTRDPVPSFTADPRHACYPAFSSRAQPPLCPGRGFTVHTRTSCPVHTGPFVRCIARSCPPLCGHQAAHDTSRTERRRPLVRGRRAQVARRSSSFLPHGRNLRPRSLPSIEGLHHPTPTTKEYLCDGCSTNVSSRRGA